jgi:DNA-binding IclR family transcriptional regulator
MDSRFNTATSQGSATGVAKTLVKALRILGSVAAHPEGLTLSDLSRTCRLPKPTAHRVLGVLVQGGMLRLDADGGYRLGPECLVLGTAFLENLDLRDQARDILFDLVERTGETCHLGVLDGKRVVYIEKVESPHPIRMASRVGRTNPAHSTGIGKAMLAFSPAEQIEAIIAAGLEQRTPRTITDPSRLRNELAMVAKRGYAIDDIENEESIRCIAAPVFDHEHAVVAGISIAGPEYRLSLGRLVEMADDVREAARELSRRVGYPDGRRGALGLSTPRAERDPRRIRAAVLTHPDPS